MSWLLPYRIHPRTLRRTADPQLSLLEDFPSEQSSYLYNAPAPTETAAMASAGGRDVLLWRLPVGESTIDPTVVAGYCAKWKRSRPLPLAIAPSPFDGTISAEDLHPSIRPEDNPDGLLFDRVEEDLAWRLERHWHVEWSDRGEYARPPVLLVAQRGVYVLGSPLPPKSRPALAALGAFPLVTANELRATIAFLKAAPLSAPELSRVLRYCEESGILAPAPEHLATAYWNWRGRRDRRPLRLFVSAAAQLTLSHGIGEEWTSPWQLDSAESPTHESRALLESWKEGADDLRYRGVRSI